MGLKRREINIEKIVNSENGETEREKKKKRRGERKERVKEREGYIYGGKG